jgi:two-component system cell cycle response regulator CtrA
LLAKGFVVEIARNGEDARDLGELYDFDLILLDLDLPDMSGLEVLRDLRREKVQTPIMIMTGSDGVETKVKALSGGADDYICKPFHKDELIARMRAVIRRSKGFAHSVISIGELTIDLDAKLTYIHGQRVHLTGREYQTLELLALRKGKTLNKELFLNSLYGGVDEPEAKIIDVFICKLRKKLTLAGGGKTLIETVWGGGYMMRDPAADGAGQPIATAA